MFIRSDNPAERGSLVKFECPLGADRGVIAGVGRVVWSRHSAEPGFPTGMGVKFVRLDAGCDDLIEGVLDQPASIAPRTEAPELPDATHTASEPEAPRSEASSPFGAYLLWALLALAVAVFLVATL